MKIKLAIFLGFFLMTGLFSGCSEKIIELRFDHDEKSEKGSSSVAFSLKNDDDGLIGNVKQESIREVLSKNENLKCSWRVEKQEPIEEAEIDNQDEEVSGGIEEGIIYLAGGKFKQEIKIKENSRENLVSILRDGNQVHQWSSIIPQGTKMTLKKSEELEIINFDKKYNWNCEEWEFDVKIFQVPEEINFIEIREEEVFL